MNDLIISRLRTLIPKLYGVVVGALLVWLGANAPWVLTVLETLGLDLNDPAVVAAVSLFVIGLVEAAWYEIWRRLEPRLPDWLTRLVLGSAKSPSYNDVLFPPGMFTTGDRAFDSQGNLVRIGAVTASLGAEAPTYELIYPDGRRGVGHDVDLTSAP